MSMYKYNRRRSVRRAMDKRLSYSLRGINNAKEFIGASIDRLDKLEKELKRDGAGDRVLNDVRYARGVLYIDALDILNDAVETIKDVMED